MQWKPFRYRLEWLGVRALVWVIPKLPRRTCASLGKWVGWIVYAIDGKGRNVALSNIEAALGDEYGPAEQRRIARESYEYFGRTMMDLFWAPGLAKPDGKKHLKLKGQEYIPTLRTTPTAVLVAHFAGFEWISLGCGLFGVQGYTLTQAFKNPLLDKFFTDLRTCTGQHVITQDVSMLRMLRQVMKGRTVGMLIDLNLSPSQSATVIETFGMKMCATYLHTVLAQRAGAHLVPVTSHPQPDGTCEVEIHEPLVIAPGSTRQQIAQQAWDFFEKVIRKDPGMWMWSYKHWRFRPKGATHPYPFYANESAKFEKLLKEEQAESGAAHE